MSKVKSILPAEMKGVMKITGYRGIGKSFLAAQADNPANIAYYDFESKAEGIHSQLNFGLYRAMTQEVKVGDPIALYNLSMKAFNTIEQDRYTVAVIDNVSPLELAMNAEGRRGAKDYAQEFGLNLRNVMKGAFGGTKPIVNFMIATRICNVLHSRGVRLIVAISHIGSRWGAGGPIPNKRREKGADKWQELSILSLILIPGSFAPIPAALVQKEQLGTITWDSEAQTHTVQRRLPFRIPKCTFAEIRRYLQEPADLRNPAEGEVPTEEESSPFSEKLSREQIALMRLALEKSQREERQSDALFASPEAKLKSKPAINDVAIKVIKSLKGKLPPKAVADQVGVTVPDVLRVWKNA